MCIIILQHARKSERIWIFFSADKTRKIFLFCCFRITKCACKSSQRCSIEIFYFYHIRWCFNIQPIHTIITFPSVQDRNSNVKSASKTVKISQKKYQNLTGTKLSKLCRFYPKNHTLKTSSSTKFIF